MAIRNGLVEDYTLFKTVNLNESELDSERVKMVSHLLEDDDLISDIKSKANNLRLEFKNRVPSQIEKDYLTELSVLSKLYERAEEEQELMEEEEQLREQSRRKREDDTHRIIMSSPTLLQTLRPPKSNDPPEYVIGCIGVVIFAIVVFILSLFI